MIASIRDGFRTSPHWAAALLIAAVAAATVLGAWFFQIVMKLEPCPLCLQQRIPYYLAVPLALAVGYAAKSRMLGMASTYGLYALAAVLVFSGLFGAYHAGIEWGWWQGPSTCAAGSGGTGGNLIGALKETRFVPCNEAPIRILGISLAGWNALISGGLALMAFNAVLKAPGKQNARVSIADMKTRKYKRAFMPAPKQTSKPVSRRKPKRKR